MSGQRLNRRLVVHQDELMPVAMRKAYQVNSQYSLGLILYTVSLPQVVELFPDIPPIEHCKLVKCYVSTGALESLNLEDVSMHEDMWFE